MKHSQLLAALLSVLSPFASAAESEIPDDIVVTATRIEQPLGKTLASTTVLTRDDIRNSQAPDVAAILRTVAGVEIAQNGGTGKPASMFLRGSNDTQVLVLLDGVRVNSATLGTTSIEHLMLDQIERIEVVRGNVSSLYGSEAIGGVIQIFTKRGRGAPAFNVSEGVGSHGTQRLSAGWGGAVENTEFNIQASRFNTDGVSAINPAIYPNANPDNDGYDNTSVAANVRHAFNADHSVSASVFNSQGHNQYDSAWGAPTDLNTSEVQVSKFSLATEDRLGAAWMSKLQLAQGVDDYHDFTNGQPTPYGSVYKTTNQQLSWQNILGLGEGKQLLAGVEYLGQQVSSDVQPGYDQADRKVNSVFVGYTGVYGVHQLQANLRQDQNSQYGTANTGLLGYGYAFSGAWRATASYSTAFRAPSFNELYYPNYGNAALKPEYAHNSEAGLHYTSSTQRVDMVYFDNRTTDLINTVLVDPVNYIYQPQNVNEARIDGVEVSYNGQFGDTGVRVAAVTQNARDVNTGTALTRRANQHGSVALTQKLGALQVGGEWQYSGTRMDGTHALQAYSVLNFSAAFALSKELKLAVRADNVTNQNDSNAYGYNPLGRFFYVSLSYQQ
ncbi:MAG TPA: TonB-dependent receptor [Gallionellaceae bacterium]|nr:TonB-dependent receptor [Gallionellaceae bacterium]